jgi:predicted membrane protein
MALSGICSPALIYLLFSATHIIMDISQGLFNMAFVKFWISIIITILLNYLCLSGLKVISWIIVFIPFILMTVITTILLLGLGLSPQTGRISVTNPNAVDRSQYDIRKKIIEQHSNSI